MTPTRRRAVIFGVVLAATSLALAACSSNAPSHPSHDLSTAPTAAAAAVQYSVPAPVRGELVRILHSNPGVVNGSNVVAPAGRAFNVDFGCVAKDPSASIGFELLHGSTSLASAQGRCNGTPYSDTALTSDHPEESVELVFTGGMSRIKSAYLILAPVPSH